MTDVKAWVQRGVEAAPYAGGYAWLADWYKKRHDEQDKYIQAMAGYFKYVERNDLWPAQNEVEFANELMSEGDYANARHFADEAAECGSEWAIQCTGYVAEGLGDWPVRGEDRPRGRRQLR